ncbi:hypothetical protein D3C71_979420 [compost metagenome]
MDAQLSAKPKLPGPRGVGAHPFGVRELQADAVHGRGQSGMTGRQHDPRAYGSHRIARIGDTAVGREIHATESDARQTRQPRKGLQVHVAVHGFQQGDDPTAGHRPQDMRERRRIGLGQHEARARGLADRRQVVLVPVRIGGVDADIGLASGGQPGGRGGAGLRLGAGRHGVFQVQDHLMRAAGDGARVTLGPVSRDKQQAAGGTVHGRLIRTRHPANW